MSDDVTLVSVDLETAGTRLSAVPIIAIGACAVDHDWEAEWTRLAGVVSQPGPTREPRLFYCELQPARWAVWDAEAEQYHGLTRERLAATGLHPVEALRMFVDWIAELGDPPYRLVSHNAAFDWAHLGAHFVHYGVADPFDPFPACTKNIARGVYRHAAEDRSGQTGLRAELGMKDHHGSHDALADALSQAVLYRRLMAVE